MNQELWRELVRNFLEVDSEAKEEVKEAQLAQCLPQLSHCATKLKFLYDQRVRNISGPSYYLRILPGISSDVVLCVLI